MNLIFLPDVWDFKIKSTLAAESHIYTFWVLVKHLNTTQPPWREKKKREKQEEVVSRSDVSICAWQRRVVEGEVTSQWWILFQGGSWKGWKRPRAWRRRGGGVPAGPLTENTGLGLGGAGSWRRGRKDKNKDLKTVFKRNFLFDTFALRSGT